MRAIKRILLVSGMALLPFAVTAQSIEEMQEMSMEERRAMRESMSDEEFAKKREQWRGEFESLPKEKKQAIRAIRSENKKLARERWESMSEEERAVAREKHKGKGKRKGHAKGAKSYGEKPVATDQVAGNDQSPE